MSLWDDVKKNVVDLYSVTSDKTTEITKVSSRRWDKFGISRDIERQFGELGNFIYTALKEGREGILEEPDVGVLMSRIEALENELRQKEAEITDIQDEHRRRRAAQRREAAEAAAAGAASQDGSADDSPDRDPAEAAVTEDDAPDVVLKDPVLERGRGESAILVEPETPSEVADDNQDEEVEVEVYAMDEVPEDLAEENDEAPDDDGDDEVKPHPLN